MALKAFIVEDQPSVKESLVEALSELGSIEAARHAIMEWETSEEEG